MENLKDIRKVYFLGIGGIGMSALARYFHAKGLQVGGYDKTPSTLTNQLDAEGMEVVYTDDPSSLPDWALFPAQDLLIVRTPAIPAESKLLNFYLSANAFNVAKRSEVLGWVTQAGRCLAVAGTHGKTTTASLLTHLLTEAGWDPTAFLGGISANLKSNVRLGKGDYMVVEADEFDRSFHTLHPYGAIITATDPDHLDIYGTEEAFRDAFETFANRVTGPLLVQANTGLKGLTYAVQESANYTVVASQSQEGGRNITLHGPHGTVEARFHYPGNHNLENALGAAALCLELGMEPAVLARGLETFTGVSRRFERRGENATHVLVDDYAHHPTELKAAIEAARQTYPGKKITGIFQPHLYSRTRDFMEGFAEALSALDTCIIMPIYPAREQPIPGITSDALMALIQTKKTLLTATQILENPAEIFPSGVVLVLGAGDIDRIVEPLQNALFHA